MNSNLNTEYLKYKSQLISVHQELRYAPEQWFVDRFERLLQSRNANQQSDVSRYFTREKKEPLKIRLLKYFSEFDDTKPEILL